MSEQQRTIAKEISMKGVGLHTGEPVSVRLLPASPDSGVMFIRADLPHRPTISIKDGLSVSEDKSVRRTTLLKGNVEVQTVEHFMAALWGAGIDNAYVEVDGIELPGMDGSALPFFEQLQAAGVTEQAAPRRYFSLREPICVEEGDASIVIFPSRSFTISYVLSYSHPALKAQFASYSLNGAGFGEAIAPARTFCLKEEAEALKESGFGKGASLDNTLVIGEEGIIKNTLRLDDEFARHKVLDLLGDLYLLGAHIKAHIIAVKSGHPLNVKLLKKLSQALEQWQPGGLRSGSPGVVVGPQLDITQIQKILPHRYPFLLVDRIVDLTETTAIGLKGVTINDYFFRGHFPGKPVMPGVLIIEAMAQVGGIILLNKSQSRGRVAYFMAVDKVKFRKPVVPGDQLVIHAKLAKIHSRTGQVTGRALVDNKVVCEGELFFALAD